MREIELLAPARDIQIGIAAIDCGADAVYIAGPQFGARQAAGNSMEDIRTLCSYAHKFGARIFVTMNTIIYDHEIDEAWRHLLMVQEAGADAIIVQDLAILELARNGGPEHSGEKLGIPLHASTQCAIRTPEQAVFLESLGFSRLILERELSLEEIRAIRRAVSCELEFFVHGAICVCYSGQCYLSEQIAGRSANRGACIQACRSRYDLADKSGRILVKDKALLSLKDYNLRNRLADLAEAGITSFKIEGRLKNISYVKNAVRDYSTVIDEMINKNPDKYVRASFGQVTGGFAPDTGKTFNRGYTELFLDGRRGHWTCMDTAKSMGEEIGTVVSLNRDKTRVCIRPASKGISLHNGDGFSFVAGNGSVTGFRGDVCEGLSIRCKSTPSLFIGAKLFRNINSAFEKEIEKQACKREIGVSASVSFDINDGKWTLTAEARTEDGRRITEVFDAGTQTADNPAKILQMFSSQLCKSSGEFRFSLTGITSDGPVPFMTTSFMNSVRRTVAEKLQKMPLQSRRLLNRSLNPAETASFPFKEASYKSNISNCLAESIYRKAGAEITGKAYELSHQEGAELMRTRYCIRYETGICPKYHHAKNSGPLYLLNNGKRFVLNFDCSRCEMTVCADTGSCVDINAPRPQK